jgi:uncharacterized protein (TIGR02246 family)
MRVTSGKTGRFGMTALALLLAAMPLVAGTPAPGSGAETAAIGKVLDEFIDALNTADLQRYAALFAPDATAFFPLAEVPLRLEDKEQITAVFGRFFAGIRHASPGPRYMNLTPVDVRVQAYGGVAIVSFHFRGGEMVSRRTLVLVRREGEWKIVHLHASNLNTEAPR